MPVVSKENIAWDELLTVREEVNKALETQRKSGVIGAGLEAAVHITAPASICAELQKLEDELRFVLITSKATFEPGDTLKIEVMPVDAPKCARCWH